MAKSELVQTVYQVYGVSFVMSTFDRQQQDSAEQFDRQSANYGRSHILADTADVDRALAGIVIPRGGEALDVATGGGHTALHFARSGMRVTLGDISVKMLEAATRLLHEEGFTPVEARRFPAEAIPFDDDRFALVSSRVAPHHFSSPEKFVGEAARVLAPGGYFLLIDGSVPDEDPETEEWLNRVEKWRDPSHGRCLSRATWEALVKDVGLEIVVSRLEPMEQPDLEWYFETAATSPENRRKVLEAVATASAHIRRAMRLREADGRTSWTWQRLSLVARKRGIPT